MFYIFTTGPVTVPANTEENLHSLLYSEHSITMTHLSLDAPLTATERINTFINWKPDNTSKWEFHTDVPIDHAFSTPEFPFILHRPLNLHKQRLELIVRNDNAVPINLCFAFYGLADLTYNVNMQPDKTTARSYNYPITHGDVSNSITVSNGVVTMPAAPVGGTTSGTVRLVNGYDDYFEIRELSQNLDIPVDTLFNFRIESNSVPLSNESRKVYVRQMFGQSNLRFKMPDTILLNRNQTLYMDVEHATTVSPVTMSPMFTGLLYHDVKPKGGNFPKPKF